ncbi:hypothetical protein Q9R08_17525 [Microbacterium sp. QXD-8]|uniref:DUF5134 domain-containing protein n=1 Tax=Microbacterium psychrotolerans TaxID=3068321 RepID=A0ABU0Z8G2_9MICO|nr:hypothetical protein [Microbacterium sp. QXD-8]MDQ7879796.1 hypothetical protein [Microbacterium sp. QXD-8]
MAELLHAWAIAPAAIGACCLAADRSRARWPDAAASVLMLVAMLDAALTRLVAPVYWAALLIACAMALAAWRRPRGRRSEAHPLPETGMAVHSGLGLIAMAALQLGMGYDPLAAASPAASAAAHGHGGGGGLLLAVLLGGALAYAVFSALLLVRAHRSLDRAQLACMGVSVVLMAAASV